MKSRYRAGDLAHGTRRIRERRGAVVGLHRRPRTALILRLPGRTPRVWTLGRQSKDPA